MTFGERLRRLRKRAGLTQEELARAVGVTLGAVRNWEQTTAEPHLRTAKRVARALGVRLDDLAPD